MKIVTKVIVDGKKVRLGSPSFRANQMLTIGRDGVRSIKARAMSGIGSDDAPMKPLSKRYGAFKTKIGKGNTRNLTLTGDMMRAFSLRYADEKQARADVTTRTGRNKARGNERRTPWFGFSSNDAKNVFNGAQKEFRANVANIGAQVRGGPRKTIWANPAGYNLTSR